MEGTEWHAIVWVFPLGTSLAPCEGDDRRGRRSMCCRHPPVLVLTSRVLNNCHPVSSCPASRQPWEYTRPRRWRAGWLKPLPGTPHTAGRRWEGSWTRARGRCSGPGSAGYAALGKSLRHFESCRLQLHNGAGILSALKDPVS